MAFNDKKLHIGKENVQALVQAVKLVWNCAPGWAVLNLFLQIIQGLLPLVNLYLIKLIIDAVSRKPASADFFHSVGILVAATAGVTLLIRLCSSLATLVQEQLSWVVSDYVNSILHSQSISLDLAYYENPAYYDTLHMAQQEAPYRPNQVVSTLANLVQNGIQMVAMVALLMRFHWSAILFLLPVALPGILIKMKYSRRLFGLRRQQSSLERESSYYDWMLISQYFAKEVRLFNLGPLFIERYRALRKKKAGGTAGADQTAGGSGFRSRVSFHPGGFQWTGDRVVARGRRRHYARRSGDVLSGLPAQPELVESLAVGSGVDL